MDSHKKLSFHVYSPAAWLRVTGADAETFLQGQITNDLRAAAPAKSVYGLWLEQKGKVLADSFVMRSATKGEFWLMSYFSPAAVIRGRLEAYIIADDVIIEDATDTWAAVSVVGDTASTGLAQNLGRGFSFSGRRTRAENEEWIFPAEYLPAVRDLLLRSGARELPTGEIERLRIEAGIPAVPKDIGPGELPNEGGLEIDAISYTKGCYLGQEVMARLKSMGRVRRRLLRIEGTGEPAPALPAALFAGDRKVGELRSAVTTDGGFVGLALLSLLHLDRDSKLTLSSGGEATVVLIDRP